MKTLQEIVENSSISIIEGTDIEGNEIIGNAIRSLNGASLKEAEIFLEDIGDDVKGFLYEKEDRQLFIIWDETKKNVSEIIIDEDSDITEEDILQAILLIESMYSLSGFDFLGHLPSFIGKKSIDAASEEGQLFAEAIKALENILQKSNYRYALSIEPFSVNESKNIDVIDEMFSTISSKEVEKRKETTEAKVETETKKEMKTEVKEEEVAEKTTEPIVEQLSFLDDEFVKVPHKKTTVEKAQKRKAKKQSSVEMDTFFENLNDVLSRFASSATFKPATPTFVEEERPAVTELEVRKHNKYIHDDAEVIAYLEKMDISPKIIRMVKKFRQNQVKNVLTLEQMMEIPNELKYKGWSEPLEMALVAVLTRNHLLLKGGAGSGKTTLMRTVGTILNMGVITATGSRDASIETFIGFKEVQDGNIVVRDGAATRAAKNGFIFVLEEGNAVLPSVLIQLHNLFDDTRRFYNEFTGETVYAHPHHTFATLINEGYEGTNDLNAATKDRLLAIEMPYMRSEDLKEMLYNYDAGYSDFQKELLGFEDPSRKDIIILTEIAKALQAGVNDGVLDAEIASIRNITDLFEITRIYPIEKAIIMVVQKYDEESRRQIMEILDTVDVLEFSATDIIKIS